MKITQYFCLFLLLPVYFGISKTVNAQDEKHAQHYISINATAYHLKREPKLNEINPGVGYEVHYGNARFLTGVYYNSYERTSAYALLSYVPINLQFSQNIKMGLGIAAGVVSGYKEHIPVNAPTNIKKIAQFRNLGLIPTGAILLSLDPVKRGGIGMNLFFVPPIKKYNMEGFFALQFKVAL